MTAAAAPPVRILIADDDDLFAKALVASLQRVRGLDIVGRAADGLEAVELVSSLVPDVVLMDIAMPRLDGISATRRITDAGTGTRVLIVSAMTDAETAGRARSAGAAAYFFKGCSTDDLVAAIREVAPSPNLDASTATWGAGGGTAPLDRLELLERLPAAAAVAQ